MKRKMMAVAVLGGFGVAAHAQSSVTLYGLIDAGVTYVSNAAAGTGHDSLFKYGDGVAQGSRWGLKGTEDLGGGLKAVFTLEDGFSSGDGTIGQGGAEFGRQAWVGLSQDGTGTLALGRQYSFSTDYLGGNYAMGSQTAAGNYAFHINDLDQLTSSRINNSIKFSSANFYGLTFGALYGFSNQAGAFTGSPTTTVGTTTTQGSSSTLSFGANYATGPFSIGAAYTSIRFPNAATPAFSVSVANVNTNGLHELETYGVGARYLIGPVSIWGLWTHTEFQAISAASSKLDNFELAGKYSLTPAFSLSLGDTYSKLSGNFQGKWNQVNAVADYLLSKRTDVYFFAGYQKASGSNTVAGKVVPVQAEIGSSSSFIGNSGTGADDQVVARIGLRVKF